MNEKEINELLAYLKAECINSKIEMLSTYKILHIVKKYFEISKN